MDFFKCGSINAIRNYIDTLHSYGCINFTDKATRITPKTATLIDHIYSNIIIKSVRSGIFTFDISGHLPGFCIVKFTNKFDNSCRLHRNFTTFNREEFADLNSAAVNLASYNLTASSRYFTSPPIDEGFTSFLKKFSEILNKHAPLQKTSEKSKKQIMKPWITKGILKSIKTKNKLFHKCYKRKRVELISFYKKYLNKLTSQKRVAKEQFYISQINSCKNDPAKLWKVVNEILDSKPTSRRPITRVITDLDNAPTDLKEISEALNDFFAKIGPTLCSKFGTSSTRHSAIVSVKSSMKFFFF